MGIDALASSDTTGMVDSMQVKSILEKLLPETKNIPVILHLHDTRGLGLVNVMAALECGIAHFGVEVAAKVSDQKVDINPSNGGYWDFSVWKVKSRKKSCLSMMKKPF